jgi:hypothetical protein
LWNISGELSIACKEIDLFARDEENIMEVSLNGVENGGQFLYPDL